MKIKVDLTVTWDVLKHIIIGLKKIVHTYLTVTWDVLKQLKAKDVYRTLSRFNSNMRCIEA